MDNITDERLEELRHETWGFRDSKEPTMEALLATELLAARKSIDTLIEQLDDISTGIYVQTLLLTNDQLIKTNDNLRKQLSTLQEALDTKEKVYGKLLSDYTALKEKQA